MRPDEKLDALLSIVRDDDRVCPRPLEWQKFWESLPCYKANLLRVGNRHCLLCWRVGGAAQINKKLSESASILSGQPNTVDSTRLTPFFAGLRPRVGTTPIRASPTIEHALPMGF
jgi:hypothetical protein